ncbi:hypothetical protein [Deinococcus sp. QL22]|uniref:hypothetical protein n=1 Tax=Deinococcus sp. QL22 TaxID=2939437 RepID=UPI0020171501|nr:hypothetical protein [Deinococcus sp. QL22]UQN05399.1 hypothetical protein M1R55_10980 [Deinococcus sp. QL22]
MTILPSIRTRTPLKLAAAALTLALASCGSGPGEVLPPLPPVPPVTAPMISGTVELGTTIDGESSAFHTRAEAAGRALEVRPAVPAAAATMAMQALSGKGLSAQGAGVHAQAITVSPVVLASTVVGTNLRYALGIPAAPPQGSLMPARSVWPEGSGVQCTREVDLVSDAAAQLVAGEFILAPGAGVDHADLLVSELLRASSTALLSNYQELIYADRALVIRALGTCTFTAPSGAQTRVAVDVDQSFAAGWNVAAGSLTLESSGGRLAMRSAATGTLDLYALD